MPETCFDRYLPFKAFAGLFPAPVDHRTLVWTAGMRSFLTHYGPEQGLTEEELGRVSTLLSQRTEVPPYVVRGYNRDLFPKTCVSTFLSRVCNPDPTNPEVWGSQVDSRVLKDIGREIVPMLRTHHDLQLRAPRLTLPLTSEVSLSMVYQTSSWEGIGAVFFYGNDSNYIRDVERAPFADQMPLFVVRGNPNKSESGSRFEIRTVQPWVSERVCIKAIKNRQGWLKNLPDEMLETLDRLIQDRSRLTQRVERLMNVGEHGQGTIGAKAYLGKGEIFTFLAMAYLEALGISEFYGIQNAYHPLFEKEALPYDTLFAKWFEDSTGNEMYPRKFSSAGYVGHLPQFPTFPDRARIIMADTFHAVSEAACAHSKSN